jgi:uncharacterized membrane protein
MKIQTATTTTNTGRQEELSLARGLAIFFMICAHVLELLAATEAQDALPSLLIMVFATIPAAPLFMFAMGIFSVYSRKQGAASAFERGVLLLLAGYALNFGRGFLPALIGVQTGRFSLESVPYGNPLFLLLETDILHLAGLCFILIGLLRTFRARAIFYPILGLLLALLNLFVQSWSDVNSVFNAFVGLFYGSGETSYFPLLSWAIYPLAGVLYGTWLIRCANKKRFYVLSFFGGLAALLASIVFSGILYVLGETGGQAEAWSVYDYYHHGLLGNLSIGGMTLMWLAFIYAIRKLFSGKIGQKLHTWSRDLTGMYIVHWILIGWSVLLWGYYELELLPSFAVMGVVLIATDRLLWWYRAAKARRLAAQL